VRNSSGSERRTALFHFLLISVSMETPFNNICIRLRKQVSCLLKGSALKEHNPLQGQLLKALKNPLAEKAREL